MISGRRSAGNRDALGKKERGQTPPLSGLSRHRTPGMERQRVRQQDNYALPEGLRCSLEAWEAGEEVPDVLEVRRLRRPVGRYTRVAVSRPALVLTAAFPFLRLLVLPAAGFILGAIARRQMSGCFRA